MSSSNAITVSCHCGADIDFELMLATEGSTDRDKFRVWHNKYMIMSAYVGNPARWGSILKVAHGVCRRITVCMENEKEDAECIAFFANGTTVLKELLDVEEENSWR